MRIIPVTVLAAAVAFGLAACAPQPIEIEFEVTTPETTETDAPDTADLSGFGDLIQDFPEADTAALTALSERLDALVPSAEQVDVRVSIFEPGEVVVRVITTSDEALPSTDELRALLQELVAFTGSEVTLWTVDAMSVDGYWVKLGPVALELGLPEQFVDTWGDIELSPADLAAALA